ncbi:hypothetical protein G7Y79_00009g027420 [Physcia stellaris]|nr:hypothetical protein G7Y79_00009g027420 [Physcia stellaris]
MTDERAHPSLATLDPSEEHTFTAPIKRINEGHDVSTFLASHAYVDIMTFLMQLNRSMFPISDSPDGQPRDRAAQSMPPDESLFSDTIRRLRSLLDELERLIDLNPPDPGPRRFGNVSFRRWFEAVESRAPDLLRTSVPLDRMSARINSETTAYTELEPYLLGSFGSAQRLDYGTGHELSFLAFLGCIWKLGGFQSQEPVLKERNIVLSVIEPYLQLVRKLIKTYTLEPAGSHGVWGLDDHSFLPYVFGSAQYGPAISQKDPVPVEGSHPNAPNPADVTKAVSVERLRKTNMYFAAIGFINDVKTGPFWEHSPTLYDISGVKGGWGKINKGMIKMYNVEVLSKFPVVQHFRFGSLFSWDRDPNAAPPPSSIHSSSQPPSKLPSDLQASTGSLNTARPTPTATAVDPRSMAQNTPAPWASNGPATTAAPWAQFPSTKSSLPELTRSSAPRQLRANGAQQQIDASRNPGTNHARVAKEAPEDRGTSSAMPPPLRAPWARKPA